MTISLSIIIPVYNVENYLRPCLDSAKNQTLTDIEIICIDDGSTDSSGEICDEYAANDSRFVVIHQPNSGQSVARNKGIEIARGEYIAFLDSDDWLDDKMCERTLSSFTEDSIDIVQFQYLSYKNSGVYTPSRYFIKPISTAFEERITSLQNGYAVWNKLYRTAFLRNNGITFLENHNFEDVIFSHQCVYEAKRIDYISDYLYYYRLGSGYSTNARAKEKCLELIQIYNILKQFMLEKNLSETEQEYYVFEYLSSIRSVFKHKTPKSYKKLVKQQILNSLTEFEWEHIAGKNRRLSGRQRAFFYFLAGKPLEGVWISMQHTLRFFGGFSD